MAAYSFSGGQMTFVVIRRLITSISIDRSSGE
jgi:hypothetical protein